MNNKTLDLKAQIRGEMRIKRRNLSPEEKVFASKDISEKLSSLFLGFSSVAVYLAGKDELDLTDFILSCLERQTKIYAPKWDGKTYNLSRVKSLNSEDLCMGPMNIAESAENETVNPKEIELWIIPGLAFTENGKRLGYGGGWYDRLLSQASHASTKVGVAYDFQIVQDLPTEPHDITLDKIICARGYPRQ
jgi:5-formyltetrahydrofolate cyclo-ligase